NSITLSGLRSKGIIEISDIQGRTIQKVSVIGQTQTINVEAYSKGMYLVKYCYDNTMICEKIVKE
ncbi:MAG TPA: T9SS type A sorting domain-containing protein, partial [Chitinophagaceae bacterium]|nr:T9SS type A sorting domain-containing protein [Chitinophagaceae bacterium]